MTNKMQNNLEKKIKKTLYGTPQTVIGVFPAGFGKTALKEVETILSTLWFPQKCLGESVLFENQISVSNIHLFSIVELLMRSQCLTDLRLVIFQGKSINKAAFEKKCRTIPWDFFLNRQIQLKIKVDSIASHAFHEGALKEVLGEIIKDFVSTIVKGEETEETTTLYAQLYKNKLTLSISLAGAPLFKRGYRGILSASAPLREDIAACCLAKALEYAECQSKTPEYVECQSKDLNTFPKFLPKTLIIPFSGTGTFAFEYWQMYFKFPPVLWEREYALQKMPFFRKENFNFLLKKARENCALNHHDNEKNSLHLICIDSSENANTALRENNRVVKEAVLRNGFSMPDEWLELKKGDFLEMDMKQFCLEQDQENDIFMPLNPPYGIRLKKHSNPVNFYKKIARQINEMANTLQPKKRRVFGFILCPTEATWSVFCKTLNSSHQETYHFNQGGLDIRVCQFVI